MTERTLWSTPDYVRHYDVDDPSRLEADLTHYFYARQVAAQLQGSDSLLDVGCAVGSLRQLLQRLGHSPEYTGVDLTPEFIARAQQKFDGVRFEVANATELPFEDGSFDVVASKGTLFVVDDPFVGVGEAVRVSRRVVVLDLVANVRARGDAATPDAAFSSQIAADDARVHAVGRGQITLLGHTGIARLRAELSPHRVHIDTLAIGLSRRADAHPAYRELSYMQHLAVTIEKVVA